MKAYAYLRNLSRRTIALSICSVLFSTLLPLGALASTYGSGSYGNCAYSTGCPQSSTSSPAAASTPATTPATILLNDFPEFFSSAGKDLTLTQGQVVNFDLSQQRYTITVVTVGADSADITISPSAISAHFTIGQAQSFDVNGDGKNDIEITLKSITDAQAVFNFRSLSGSQPTNTTTPSTAGATPTSHLIWWLLLGLFGLFLFGGIWWFLWLRRRRKDQTPITTNQPPH